MNRRSRRILTCLICVLLFCTMVMPAWAAVVNWTEDGKVCAATVTKSGTSYVIPVPIEDASVIYHEKGEAGVITWPLGYVATQTPVYNGTPDVDVKGYVEQAATLEGIPLVSMSCELSDPEADFYELKSNLPDGTYSFGSEFTVWDATWNTSKSELSGYALNPATSGTITGIPVSCTNSKLIVISLD